MSFKKNSNKVKIFFYCFIDIFTLYIVKCQKIKAQFCIKNILQKQASGIANIHALTAL